MLPNSNFNANVLAAINPGVIKDNAAFTSQVIGLDDEAVRGAQSLTFSLQIGSIDADLGVFRIQESDTKTDATTLGGTPTTIKDITATVTPGATDDNKVYLITVDLGADRKKYLQLQVTAGDGAAGTYASAVCFAVAPGAIQTNNNAAARVAA